MFNIDLFKRAVDEYVAHGCMITYNQDETTTMRRVYDDFQHWTRRHGNGGSPTRDTARSDLETIWN